MVIVRTPSARGRFFRPTAWAFGLSACFLLAFAGCSSGPPHYKVRGKVVDGDKAVLPDPSAFIGITFVEKVEGGQSPKNYDARLSADDGSFQVVGLEQNGIPAGKYRVKLFSVSPAPSAFTKLLNQKFGNEKTPIEVEVVDDRNPVVIDIAPYKKK